MFFDMVLKWFYPPRCVLCESLLKIGKEEILCKKCENTLQYNDGAVCQKCGQAIYTSQSYCFRCQKTEFVFEKGIAVFSYDIAKKGIAHFKLKGWKKDAIGFGKLMGDYLLTYYPEIAEQTDLLIPVPMYAKKQIKRGFNQSELLAEELAKRIGKQCSTKNLKRIRETIPQSRLSAKERKENIKNAFALEAYQEVLEKNILLIDDIFTTGTTLNECAKVLYENGAAKVLFFTLSIVEE